MSELKLESRLIEEMRQDMAEILRLSTEPVQVAVDVFADASDMAVRALPMLKYNRDRIAQIASRHA